MTAQSTNIETEQGGREAQLVDDAAGFVHSLTGQRPDVATLYDATRGDALEAVGSGAESAPEGDQSREAILIEFAGRFEMIGISRPPEAPAPIVEQIVVLVDAASGDLLDFGYLAEPVDIGSSLGPGRESSAE